MREMISLLHIPWARRDQANYDERDRVHKARRLVLLPVCYRDLFDCIEHLLAIDQQIECSCGFNALGEGR